MRFFTHALKQPRIAVPVLTAKPAVPIVTGLPPMSIQNSPVSHAGTPGRPWLSATTVSAVTLSMDAGSSGKVTFAPLRDTVQPAASRVSYCAASAAIFAAFDAAN